MKFWKSLSLLVTFALTLVVVSLFSGNLYTQAASSIDYVDGQLVISVEDKKSSISAQNAVDAVKDSTVLKRDGFDVVDGLLDQDSSVVQAMSTDFKEAVIKEMGLVYLVEYSTEQYPTIEAAKEALEQSLKEAGLNVRYVQGNYVMKALEAVPQDYKAFMHPSQNWHYQMIKASEAWNITTGSSTVRIAVLDTGIDSNHPSLSNLVNTSLGRSFVGGTTGDGHGHGTHVAGTIASYGTVSGVMKNATLVPIKVLDETGYGSMYGIQQGIIYSASIQADVINMSLGGGPYDRGMDEAVTAATNQGSVVVAATGNDGVGTVSYPAAYQGSIAVGSVTSAGDRSYFSNYGQGLDVMAPGSNIYSTMPGGRYGSMSGTSMATPHVAGLVGLMRTVNPNISVSEVRSILKNTAQPAGPALQYGSGIVNALAAVQAANGGGGTPDPDRATVTTVSTDKSVYKRGDNIVVTGTVKNEQGSPLSGANVSFELTRPNGTKVTESATTNAQGVATWTLTSNAQTLLGTFTIKATSTLSGYTSSTATTTIEFSEDGSGTPDPDPQPGTAWAPNVNYTAGQEVTYGGSTYICQISHRSLQGWEPNNTPALWKLK